MRSILRGTMAAALGLAQLGAEAASGETGPPGDIVNGTPTTRFPAVAALFDEDLAFFCTAFLIRPSCLLTAAHCVTFEPPGPGSLAYFGSNVMQSYTYLINIRDYEAHPGFNGVDPAHDVAVISLESATDIAPLETDVPGSNMSPVTIVGFGYDANFDAGIKRTATVTQLSANATSIVTDGTVSNICGGDSGSPLLRDVGGTLKAIGIASSADLGCNQVAFWERLSSDLDFVNLMADELCVATQVGNGIFLDGFESEDTGAWSATEPP